MGLVPSRHTEVHNSVTLAPVTAGPLLAPKGTRYIHGAHTHMKANTNTHKIKLNKSF